MDSDESELRREIARLKVFAALSGLVIGVLVLGAFVDAPGPEGDVLRAQGLVIEDAQGRPRILLGAPVPEVESRVRADTARVREAWAQRYPDPDGYMENYRNRIRHSMNGLLVINDEQGYERSGYGLLEVDGRDRVVLGLDSRGREGVTLSLKDEGDRGLSVYDGETTVFVGAAPADDPKTGLDHPFRGLLISRGDSLLEKIGRVGSEPRGEPDR